MQPDGDVRIWRHRTLRLVDGCRDVARGDHRDDVSLGLDLVPSRVVSGHLGSSRVDVCPPPQPATREVSRKCLGSV